MISKRLNKTEILVRTWEKKTLIAGIKRQQESIADLKHEWMGTSEQLKKLCKLQALCDIYLAELATR